MPLVLRRTVELVTASDARVRELFERADVVSEGAPFGEDPDRAYFGSSDIVLLVERDLGERAIAELAHVAGRDPHVRLRALRIAHREAAQRAHGPIDSVRAEVNVAPSQRGVVVHVEVEARIHPDRRTTPRSPPLTRDRAHATS